MITPFCWNCNTLEIANMTTTKERGEESDMCSLGLSENMELFLWSLICESMQKVILYKYHHGSTGQV